MTITHSSKGVRSVIYGPFASLVKSKGFDAKVRGNSLWLEGRHYGSDDIARIPHNDINIEMAKTIEVDSGVATANSPIWPHVW